MDPFLGEIRYFAFDFAPDGWAACDGASMNAQQNMALFALLGQIYGGDGRTTYNLPDLRGRVPMHSGVRALDNAYFKLGTKAGSETVELTGSQIPTHTHDLYASATNPANTADSKSPTGNLTGNNASGPFTASGITGLYNESGAAAIPVTMHSSTVQTAGAGTGHKNCAPSFVLMPCIAVKGIFPSRN